MIININTVGVSICNQTKPQFRVSALPPKFLNVAYQGNLNVVASELRSIYFKLADEIPKEPYTVDLSILDVVLKTIKYTISINDPSESIVNVVSLINSQLVSVRANINAEPEASTLGLVSLLSSELKDDLLRSNIVDVDNYTVAVGILNSELKPK